MLQEVLLDKFYFVELVYVGKMGVELPELC
jgi:hypothetical protein